MKLLWLVRQFPLQGRGGAHSYSRSIIKRFLEAGAQIDLVYVGQDVARDQLDEFGPTAFRALAVPAKRAPRIQSLTSALPAATHQYKSKLRDRYVSDLLSTKTYDYVVFDHIGSCGCIDVVEKPNIKSGPTPYIYVSHNHEASLRRRVARFNIKNPFVRLYAPWDAEKAVRLEQRVVAGAALTTAITTEDLSLFQREAPGALIKRVRPAYAGPTVAPRTLNALVPRRILVFGSLEWQAKVVSFARFLQFADGPFRAAGVMVDVIGSARPELVAEMNRRSWVTYHGVVKDITHIAQNCRLGLVVDQEGGGFKTKMLDYMFLGLPVFGISSQMNGMEGMEPGRDYMGYDSLETLIAGAVDAIDDLPLLGRLQGAALKAASETFTEAVQAAEVAEVMACLMASGIDPDQLPG